jgi:predicted house-cleaning noncanonical NTP pyrophosphatase (MazG superfamily)
MELQQPNSIISLATSAVLVSVDVNVWSATKQDRGISDEVTNSKNADHSAGRFVKNLLADNIHHKKVANYRQTIYNWMKRSTYRWNNSQDLLPVLALEKFKAEYQEHEAEYYRLLDDFLLHYTSIVSDMAFKQGDMFNRNDYPDVQIVRSKFGIRLFVAEVPTQDFRCAVSEDIADDLKQQYEAQAGEIVTGILSQQQERLAELLQSISHCCGVQEISVSGTAEIKTKKRKIYDTTIEKARELCSLYKDFNLTGNTDLAEASRLLENTLNGVSAELIRDSDAVRNRVKDDIDDILGKFSF